MEHINGTAQGLKEPVEQKIPVDEKELPEPDLATIKRWLTRDLGACISFLQMLYSDTELQENLAVWLKGRITNRKNAERNAAALKDQTKIFE